MEENNIDNKLTILDEDNQEITLNVLDIIESDEFKKTFIIYTIDGIEDAIYGSILNENDETYTIDTVTNQNEIDYLSNIIKSVSEEIGEE